MKQPYLQEKWPKRVAVIAAILLSIVAIGFMFRDDFIRWFMRPTESALEQGVLRDDLSEDIDVIAQDLDIPWEMVFLPGGDKLVTERPGTLQRIGEEELVVTIDGVEHFGEGGLLGMALHPDFESNNYIYLYFTSKLGDKVTNRVERYVFSDNELSQRTEILGDIPGANYHDGGRIAFGPDGHLYIATGDAGQEMLAQDTSSLAGKILRITDQGDIPDDNPFNNEVFAYGIRNSQGLAWDDQNRLWAIDHGRSGLESGFDELNLIEIGENYGWPIIEGDETREGMKSPIAHSGADETWAPAGLAYHQGSLFFTGLRGESLYQAEIVGDDSVRLTAHFRGDFGRLRMISIGPDSRIYVGTSNQDGRGTVNDNDDKIIKINAEKLR